MEMANYWKQFENTGKVEDYLSYKAVLPKEANERVDGQDAANRHVDRMSGKDRQQGAGPYAGIY